MANPQQLALLKNSVTEWNQWREENPELTPDLRYANFQKTDLEGANLTGANLQDAFFFDANLRGTILNGANLTGAVNLTCEQIHSFKSLDNDTRFSSELEVRYIREYEWTCKDRK